MKYAYYPGCSLETTCSAYDLSTRAVASVLGQELSEIDDWNCCGATEYFTLNQTVAYSVIARNLALVEPGLDQLVAPCSACYLNLKKTDKLMQTEPAWRERISAALTAGGLSYQPGRVKVRHLLDVFINDVGAETIKTHVVQPLKGLRVAPYYGCQIVRPMNGDNPEYPTQLDELLAWLGAEVIDYPLKTHCCGGHMTQISEALAFELIRRLLYTTAEYEADLIACLCPMCQLNLDAYQGRVNNFFNTTFNIPILFFTQLVGLAFGLRPTSLGFGKEIVPAEPVLLAKLGVETEEGEAPGHKPTPKGGLPMPRME